MKLACEIVILDVLPVIRKELTTRLVDIHKYTKTNVAKMFGISGTAVSQYIHGMRGDSSAIEDCPQYNALMKEITLSAERIASKESTVGDELCRLCDIVKQNGIIEHLHRRDGWRTSVVKCAECPKKDMC